MDAEFDQREKGVEFNTALIDLKIRDSGEYGQKGKAYFKLLSQSPSFSSSSEKGKYLGEINEGFHYIGLLSEDLEKEGVGVNLFPNGDIYLGQWDKDQKNGSGLYKYAGENKAIGELYVGQWVNGVKEGKGVYFWVTAPGAISQSTFDMAYGTFAEGSFVEGMLFQQVVDEKNERVQEVYIGKVNKERQKHDEMGMLLTQNLSFIGEFKENEIIQGRICFFKDEEEKIEHVYSYKKEGEKIETIQLNKSEEEDYIRTKKKHNLNTLLLLIENYYLSIHNIGPQSLDFNIFEKDCLSLMDLIRKHFSFLE